MTTTINISGSNNDANLILSSPSAQIADEATTPEVTTPEVTTPEVTTPEVTTPQVTTPQVSEISNDLLEKVRKAGVLKVNIPNVSGTPSEYAGLTNYIEMTYSHATLVDSGVSADNLRKII